MTGAAAGFRPIAATVAERCAADPDRVAIEWAGRALTYGQLGSWAQRIAAELGDAGLVPGDRVAIAARRSAGLVAAVVGTLAAGGVIVPIDRSLPPHRRRVMLDGSGAALAVTVGDDQLAGTRPGPALGEWPAGDLDAPLVAEPRLPDDPAYVFFTSGSTGVPKGVLGTQLGLSSFMEWMREAVAATAADRVSLLRSISFDASLREIFLPLVVGATLVIAPDPLDPDDAATWLSRRRVTILNATPSHAAVWLDAVAEPLPSSLRWTCFSGERLDPALVGRWRESLSPPGQVANLYGPTETTMIRTFDVVAADPGDGPLPVGRALPHSKIHVLDADGRACSVGAPGEVVIATEVGTLGYLDGAEAHRFVADPDGGTAPAYRTGDRGWMLEDGRLVVSGRLDDQVQILGVRIEPGEVTAALNAHPGIDRAAVVAVPDARTGHHLVAFVRPAAGIPADEADWRAHLLERVLGPAVPHRFIEVETFPLTSNGKIDRVALLARLDGDRPATVPPPAQTAEQRKAALSPAKRALLEARLRPAASPAAIEERVASLGADGRQVVADALRRRVAAVPDPGPVARPAPVREAPLSFAQERLWFLDQLFPDRSNYNIPRAFRLQGRLDEAALRSACDQIHARHEALRTRYEERAGEPVQVVDAPGPSPFEVVALPGRSVDDEEVRARIAAEFGRRFDLAEGPVWKVTLIRLGPAEHVLTVVTHHIASDGWSLPPLYSELTAGYAAARGGGRAEFDPLPIQYADYAIRQRELHEVGGFEDDLAFWAAELAGAPDLLSLPGSSPRPPVPSHAGARIRFRFDQAPSERLTQLARDHAATPFMIGLALYQGYLSRISGMTDLVVGVPSADRVTGDLQHLVGFFVNSLAMRARIEPGMTFRELLESVRTAAIRSYDHREVPFEHVVRRLAPPRSTDRSPIFQVFFQYGTAEFNTPLVLEGIECERLVQETDGSKFDLTLYMGSSDGRLGGSAVYNTDLFDGRVMERIIDGFGAFCAAALADPDRRLDDLPTSEAGVPITPMRPAPPTVTPPAWSVPTRGHDEDAARIAAVWEEVLGRPVELDDDFFELGGHSLMAIRVFSRLEAEFGRPFPIGAIFEAPTPRGLAARLVTDEGADRKEPEVIPLPVEEIKGPLSFAQRRLWFLDRLTPGAANYHTPWRIRLQGALDLGAMRSAVQGVVERHGVFRARFVEEDGEPVQVIAPVVEVPMPVEDLSGLAEAARPEALARRLGEEAREPFDLSTGPLVRARIFKLAEDDHVISVVAHHIATDAESLRILRNELREFYAARLEGRAPALPELDVQFIDVAKRQRDRFDGESAGGVEEWVEALRGVPPILELPADRMRTSGLDAEAGNVTSRAGSGIAGGLRRLAAAEQASPFMLALAAFAVLVHRHTREDDFLIGIPSTERSGGDTEHLMGFFVNTLPIRIDASGRPTFRELVARVRRQVLFAVEHGDVPLELIVDRLDVPRDASRNPLFQIVFDMNQPGGRRSGFPGLETVPIGVKVGRRAAKFDLRVHCRLGKERFLTSFDYRDDLFEPETMEAMAGQYSEILEAVIADPDHTIDDIPLMTDRARPFVDEDRYAEWAPRLRLMERFRRIVERHRDDVAVADVDLAVSYGRLAAAASDVAGRLTSLGIGPGSTVGVSIDRSAALVAAVLGILEAGAAYVPLDPAYPAERLAVIERDAAISAVLTADRASPLGVSVEITDDGRPLLDPADEIAYVMYTSGSTGTPKGVMVPERAIWRLVVDPDYVRLGSDAVVGFASNTAFDAATFEIWGALLNGATLRVLSRDTMIAPDRLATELREAGVTTMFLTTALFKAVVAQRPDAFAGLRELLFGGEAADVTAVRRCLAAGPPARLINAYGPTETTTFAATHHIERLEADARTVPIGRPIRGTSLRIVDERGGEVGIGVPGELLIGGPGVAVGYIGDPELTAGRFVAGPGGSTEYRTGDLVRRRSDGSIEYLGRLDRQIKMRGYRIEPGEIEAHLTAHPEVAEAAVVPVTDASGKRLAAYVVADPDRVDGARLADHLSRRLPPFMVPAAIELLPELPRTPNGKLDVAALPTPTVEAAPYVPPTGEGMVRMAELWQEVLDVVQVGATDDFFALGGHSLLAIKLFAAIEREFGRAEPLSTLFEAPTLAAMTSRILGEQEAPPPVAPELPAGVVTIRAGGPNTPLFCLPPAGGNVMVYEPMARAFDGERPVYGIEAPGVDGRQEPLRTIEELAAHCERLIVAAHPKGPYLLVGYSMGGLVAWEVARRLRAAGRQVDLLGLIDARLGRRMSATERVRTDVRIVRRYRADGARLVARRIARSVRTAAGTVRHAPGAMRARLAGRALDPIQAGRRLTSAGLEATLEYEPQPYDGPAFYFRAESLPGPWGRGGVGRWRRVAGGGLEIIELPGTHKGAGSVMHEPNAGVLAKEIGRIIERGEQL